MKPDWRDAPEWAKWLAMDQNGEWHWYEERPSHGMESWIPMDGRMLYSGADSCWKDSLEQRSVEK